MAVQPYRPKVFMYYGKIDNDHKISPAANMSISVNPEYVGDHLVGYTYNINLDGTITSMNIREIAYGQLYDPDGTRQRNTGDLTDSIIRTRRLLHSNGNALFIVDAQTGGVLFRARGGIIRSFSVNESGDNWTNSAPFSASIDFDSIKIFEAEDCENPLFSATSYSGSDAGPVNINSHKIKSFNDSWSFDISDDIYNKIYATNAGIININNVMFTIQYRLEATGKTQFDYGDDETNGVALGAASAWVNAKTFVQKRLKTQVGSLISNILKQYSSACSSTDTLSSIDTPATGTGIVSDLQGKFVIADETIVCESSESAGTFSVSYSCKVCSTNGNSLYSSPYVNHSVSVGFTRDYNFSRPENKMSLSGTIQGMVPGGLVSDGKEIELQDAGIMFLAKQARNDTHRFNQAKAIFANIFSEGDYGGGLGTWGKIDFKKEFKQLLGITAQNIGINEVNPEDPYKDSLPHPTNVSLTRDVSAGTISYSAEYSNIVNACGTAITSISISEEPSMKKLATFEIPNRGCIYVQDLNIKTSRKMNITIEGKDQKLVVFPINIAGASTVDCGDGCSTSAYVPVGLPSGKIIDMQVTTNPINGTYQVNLGYLCDNDCSI